MVYEVYSFDCQVVVVFFCCDYIFIEIGCLFDMEIEVDCFEFCFVVVECLYGELFVMLGVFQIGVDEEIIGQYVQREVVMDEC